MRLSNMGLDEKAGQKIADCLAGILASTYTLYLKTQNYHWNVTGPLFPTLHLLFEKQYQILAEACDEVAERIRAVDFPTPASYQEFAKRSVIEDGQKANEAKTMVMNLCRDHEKMAEQCRLGIQTLSDLNDPAGADLLTEQLAMHEKTAWMLRVQLD